jgi:hypothetical protein
MPLPLSGERSSLPFRRSLRRPRFLVGEVGALEYRGLGEMLGARIGEAIPEIKAARVPMERAERPLTWSAEKLPAGNFLDFSFSSPCRAEGVPTSLAGHKAGKD